MKSPRFSFNKEDAKNIVKVFLWSTASAGVTALIAFLGTFEVDAKYAILIPVINTGLVALKKFVEDRTI
jgi:hypothetical protein